MPQTVPDGFEFEQLTDGEPTRTLNGGSAGTSPILAEQVQDVVSVLRSDIQGVADDVADLQPVVCRAERGTNQSIPHNTDTEIQLQNFRHNVGGFALSSGRVVVPVHGIYAVLGGIRWAGDSTGWRRCEVRHWPGATVLAGNSHAVGSGISQPTMAGTDWEADEGQEFTVRGRQNSGGGLNALAGADTFLVVRLVARL